MMTLREVVPAYEASHPGQVQWLFCNVAQPWHPQSCTMHEACLAVAAAKPEAVWNFCWALLERQDAFFDDQVLEKSRKQLYEELAMIAEEAVALPKAELLARLTPQGPGNGGSQ